MATVAPAPTDLAEPRPPRAAPLLARRALRDARTRTIGFAYLFAGVAYLQPVAYRRTYPTLADRLGFAHSFAHNKAVVLFYGKAYDLLTVGGYTAWRVGGTLAIFAALFGLLAATRALRTEEDSGRAELLLAAPISRRALHAGALSAIAVGAIALWIGCFLGLVAGGLPAVGSAYLALAVGSVVPVFVGVGAVASQLAPTKRVALELGGAVLALSFLLRVVADTAGGAGWLRWLTPLGWAEEMRPFTGAHPVVLAVPLTASVLLLILAVRTAMRRDVGTGLLAARDSAAPHLGLLSSPATLALRGERIGLFVWTGSLGALAFVIGMVSRSVSSIGISKQLSRALEKLGVGSVLSPKAYISFSFSFFVVVLSVLAISQVAAARQEENDDRLETLLALPVGRARWLGGRLGLAAAALTAAALATGALAWAGAETQGVRLSLASMLAAGLNCLPVALLFLGLATAAWATVPRAGVVAGYGLLIVAYLWQLFGSLLGVPKWLVKATPFAHVGLVPTQSFRAADAAVMVALGAMAALAGVWRFRQRDLHGA